MSSFQIQNGINAVHDNSRDQNENKFGKAVFATAIGLAGAGALAYLASRYRVANPTEYIVRTGIGIRDIAISKQAIQFPLQTCRTLSMEPRPYSVEIDAMSKQRIPFKMPSTWTIGPDPERENLLKFARLLINKDENELQKVIEGVIHGQARILTANMELDAVFQDQEAFKKKITSVINQIIRDEFGLKIYDANIADLADLDEHNRYFSEQKRRALQKVNQEARVHVAEAIKEGECGEKRNISQTRQQTAQYEKEAKLSENDRQKEISESEKTLAIAQANFKKEQQLAFAEAEAAAEKRKWELQQEVEQNRKQQQIERLRADKWTAACVEVEVETKKAEGYAAALKLKSDADLYAKKISSDADLYAKRIASDAELYASNLSSDARLYGDQKEAEGIAAKKQAESEGLRKLIEAAGGVESLVKYLLVDQRQLPELFEQQAKAVHGMQPKVSVWNTGAHNGSLSNTLTDVFKAGIPLFEEIKMQTGYDFLGSAGVKKISDADRL